MRMPTRSVKTFIASARIADLSRTVIGPATQVFTFSRPRSSRRIPLAGNGDPERPRFPTTPSQRAITLAAFGRPARRHATVYDTPSQLSGSFTVSFIETPAETR
jgi:hypothetical protein